MPLVAHFLNVGHGDCTFIELPSGRLMMVDVNNSKSLPDTDKVALAAAKGVGVLEFSGAGLRMGRTSSWQQYYESLLVDPFDYYCENFSGQPIFRYVQTHPDMDHMSGLHRFFWTEKVTLENFWDTPQDKELTQESFDHGKYDYRDWLTYRLLRIGSGPDNSRHVVIKNTDRAGGQYWTEDGIEVFSPTQGLVDQCNGSGRYNNCSYAIRVSHGGRSIILPGDAEAPAWRSMLSDLGPDQLGCDILKAAHHGRKNGFYQPAVETMNPKIVICSVGEKPDTDASSDYARIASRVLSTRFNGTIKVTIWSDGEVWVTNHKNERLETLQPQAA